MMCSHQEHAIRLSGYQAIRPSTPGWHDSTTALVLQWRYSSSTQEQASSTQEYFGVHPRGRGVCPMRVVRASSSAESGSTHAR